MKQRKITFFWIGFIVSTAATIWLYWLWRYSRIVTPVPLVISRRESYQPVVKEVVSDAVHETPRVENDDILASRSDELEAITGIGPATARRLNQAGIYTYSQLGNLSPGQLQEISGTNRWDPNDWIDQAKKLADI